jgi:hypothetical protein
MNVVGQSHLVCIKQAADAFHVPLDIWLSRRFPGWQKLGDNVTVLDRHNEWEAQWETSTGEAPVFSFIGGGRLHVFGLFRHPTHPFDFVLPEEPGLPMEDGAEIISYRAMRASLIAETKDDLSLITRLVRRSSGPFYQFASPPPTADNRWIGAVLARVADLSVDNLNSPFLRYKVWRLDSQILRAHVEKLGGTFVGHPPEAVDEQGLLRREFCGDATHGNRHYGALVLRQMQALA